MACEAPYKITDGVKGMCRKCDACRAEFKRMWIGRLMAEHASAVEMWFTTFTYAGGYENAEAYVLQRKHLNILFQKLRNHGYKFKPLSVGEYGGEGERAHWHILFYWYTEPPKVNMGEFMWWNYETATTSGSYWPHGKVQLEYPRSASAASAYCLKYLDKPLEKRGKFSFGKRPAIGERYLLEFAERKARAGVMLFPRKQPIYQIPGNIKDKGPTAGQHYDYWLDTKSVVFARMIERYAKTWRETRPGKLIPACRYLMQWAEGLTYDEREELELCPIRQAVSLAEKAVRGADIGPGRIMVVGPGQEAHHTDDVRVALVHCLLTGAMEWHYYEDDFRGEGHLIWRKSLKVGPPGEQSLDWYAQNLPSVAPDLPLGIGLINPAPWGSWSPTAISRRQSRPSQRLGTSPRREMVGKEQPPQWDKSG